MSDGFALSVWHSAESSSWQALATRASSMPRGPRRPRIPIATLGRVPGDQLVGHHHVLHHREPHRALDGSRFLRRLTRRGSFCIRDQLPPPLAYLGWMSTEGREEMPTMISLKINRITSGILLAGSLSATAACALVAETCRARRSLVSFLAAPQAGSATSTAWLASCPGSSHSLPYVVSLKLSSVPGPRASWDATGRRGTGSSRPPSGRCASPSYSRA